MSTPIMSRFDLFFILVDNCNEVTDYAVARRIIDLHTKLEESVPIEWKRLQGTPVSLIILLVYIIFFRWLRFVRMFKPKPPWNRRSCWFNSTSTWLRQSDTGGSAKCSTLPLCPSWSSFLMDFWISSGRHDEMSVIRKFGVWPSDCFSALCETLKLFQGFWAY